MSLAAHLSLVISTTPRGRIWGRICEVGFLSFVRNPTPILPKLKAVEIVVFLDILW